MGKKGGGGGNSKVEAANAKKAANKAVKDAELSRQQEAADAADWKKGSNARADKKREEEERKRQEAERKKKELQELQAMEEHVMSKHEDKSAQRQMKAKSKSKEPARPWEEALKPTVKKNNKGSRPQIGGSTNKLTQFERDQIAEKEAAEKEKNQSMGGRNDIHFQSFEENRNREEAVEEARSIDAAIDVLSLGGEKDLERHPERRAKAAYKAWEEIMLPQIKQDFPGLKLSQYKQKLFDLWKKSPENPLNQERAAYNTKKKN